MVCTGALDFIAIASLDETLVVVLQHLWLWYDSPLNLEEEFKFQHGQLVHGDTPDARICFVRPEAVAETLAGHRGTDDQETMDGQAGDGEGGVQSAEAINVVDHAEQDWGRQGGVGSQTLQVVEHGDPRWRTGVEAS